MAINYEYERHIQAAKAAGDEKAAKLLASQREVFNSLRDAGVIQELPRETEFPQKSAISEDHTAEIEAARQLESEHGFIFERMPEDVYPGKPFVTVSNLIKSQVTEYSQPSVNHLIESGEIATMKIANKTLVLAKGVQRLLQRERDARTDVSPSRRPGRRPKLRP